MRRPSTSSVLLLVIVVLWLSAIGSGSLAASDESPPVAPSSDEDEWALRLEQLEESLFTGRRTGDDADALYAELSRALTAKRRQLRSALDTARRGPGLAETRKLYRTVASLYQIRLRLLDHLSSERRAKILGSGAESLSELKGELEHVTLEFGYQKTLAGPLVLRWLERLRYAPLSVLGKLVQLFLVLLLFRAWWSWAKAGLPRLREKLVEAGSRTDRRLRIARVLWYVDQVRRPLELLLLAEIAFRVIDLSVFPGAVERVSLVVRWTFVAWFLVRLIHAAAGRGKAAKSEEVSRLRLRSLRLLACWLVLAGLGLELVESYAGRGTLHAWVASASQLLLLPVVGLLLIWWRPTIFARLEQEPRKGAWVERLLKRRKGLRGYLNAAAGGVSLLAVEGIEIVMRILVLSDWGQELQSHWYRSGIARAAADCDARETAPLPVEIRCRLLDGSGCFIEKIGRKESRRLTELAERRAGGVVAVIADPGFGKSTLLRRLSPRLEGKILIVDCPPGGSQPLLREFARSLGLEEKQTSAEGIGGRLRDGDYDVVAVDDYHRLARPVMGGQAEMDLIDEIARHAAPRLLWVVTLNRAAWRYIDCARGHRLTLEDVLELPAWSEKQIGELIEERSRTAGIEPDFTRLVLPRRLDDGDYPTVSERNRANVYRLIWDIGGGSPAAAARIWADSLGLAEDGSISVRLPGLPRTDELETLGISFLLVLRVILQCELATPGDIVASLRLPLAEVHEALQFLLLREWIELDHEHYRISYDRYGTVVRVLNRRNLVSSREGVGWI